MLDRWLVGRVADNDCRINGISSLSWLLEVNYSTGFATRESLQKRMPRRQSVKFSMPSIISTSAMLFIEVCIRLNLPMQRDFILTDK
jgi:hypothetical protein